MYPLLFSQIRSVCQSAPDATRRQCFLCVECRKETRQHIRGIRDFVTTAADLRASLSSGNYDTTRVGGSVTVV